MEAGYLRANLIPGPGDSKDGFTSELYYQLAKIKLEKYENQFPNLYKQSKKEIDWKLKDYSQYMYELYDLMGSWEQEKKKAPKKKHKAKLRFI